MRPQFRNFALLVMLVALLGCSRGPCVMIVGSDGKTLATVQVEVAATQSSREVGLMYRKSLGADAGMIFIFKEPSNQKFWMHNTPIPLDIIFVGANGRVTGIVANAEPFSDKPVGVDGDSQYVLEVNGGFAASHHIAAGDRVDFSGFSPRASD